MNESQRIVAAKLRQMPSKEAADWLLELYPGGGEAIILLEHVSLRKRDELRLAEHYLAGPTHADARAYRHFARRLGLRALVDVLEKAERDKRDAELLAYHLGSMLDEAKDAEEHQEASAFIARLSSEG